MGFYFVSGKYFAHSVIRLLQQQEQQPASAATRYLQLQFIVTHEQIRMMQDTMSAFCIHCLLLKETVTNLCIMHGAQLVKLIFFK
jgi:hypothetical protein